MAPRTRLLVQGLLHPLNSVRWWSTAMTFYCGATLTHGSKFNVAMRVAGGELLKGIDGCEAAGEFILAQVLPSAAMMQIGYGTAIVSFLGAVHW